MTALNTDHRIKLPADVEARLTQKLGRLNMLPAVAAQALDITRDADCSLDEFSAIVERDAKLATDILSMANSVMYSPGRPILGLNQAVIRLGFQQCRNLIYSSSMASMMSSVTLSEEWVREALCQHSFVTALLALRLNRQLRVGCQGEEFTVGLMHDFGRTLLAVSFPDKFQQCDSLSFEESSGTLLRMERNVLGVDHCAVGAWFAQNNKLPTVIIEAIRLHHMPERAVLNSRLTALVTAADDIANHIQRGESAARYDCHQNMGLRALESVGVDVQNTGMLIEPLIDQVAVEAEELMNF